MYFNVLLILHSECLPILLINSSSSLEYPTGQEISASKFCVVEYTDTMVPLGVVRQPTITLLVIALVRRSVQRSPSLLTPVMEQFTIQTPADLFTYLAPSTINFQFPVELLIEIVILLSTLLHPRSANPLSYLSGDQNLWHSFCL